MYDSFENNDLAYNDTSGCFNTHLHAIPFAVSMEWSIYIYIIYTLCSYALTDLHKWMSISIAEVK